MNLLVTHVFFSSFFIYMLLVDILGMIFLLIIGLTLNKLLTILLIPLLLIFEDLKKPILTSYLNFKIIEEAKATMFSALSLFDSLGEIMQSLIFGIIATQMGINFVFIIAGLVVLLPLSIYLKMIINKQIL